MIDGCGRPYNDGGLEVTGGLVAPLVFKTSVGLDKVPGGFDSHSPPFLSVPPEVGVSKTLC